MTAGKRNGPGDEAEADPKRNEVIDDTRPVRQNRGPSARDPYLEVCISARLAIERVLAACGPEPDDVLDGDELGRADLRVFLAVLEQTAMWSRLGDRVSRKQIAERARLSERLVRVAMRRLEAVGAVRYERSRVKGRSSLVALPSHVGGKDGVPPNTLKGEGRSTPQEGPTPPFGGNLRGNPGVPPPEGSEKTHYARTEEQSYAHTREIEPDEESTRCATCGETAMRRAGAVVLDDHGNPWCAWCEPTERTA